jgi:riboflavin kinase/FMN adenylyltransferase
MAEEHTRISGVVVTGDARGRLLGFPTANLRIPAGRPLPRHGVYAGRALGRPAAVSIGVRPTFGDDLEPLVEVFLLDFEGDLYGRELTVELLERLRPERRFESIAELKDQMDRDVLAARRVYDAHE